MFDCVYIEQEIEKHDGLIVVPNSEKKLFQGTVVAVGPGVRTDHGDWIKLCLNVGDRVLFVDEGRIIEEGTPKEIFENPKQERTKLFLSKIL